MPECFSALLARAVAHCEGCGICARVCPTEAIDARSASNVDLEKCVGCGACVARCPKQVRTLPRPRARFGVADQSRRKD